MTVTTASALDHQWNWRSVEADNGAVYKIDLNSINHYSNGTADAFVYFVEGAGYNPENLRVLWFDCRGHYRDQTGGLGPVLYAPPRSAAGALADIACGTQRTPPTPDYCKGFSETDCARIRELVKARVSPVFCASDYPHNRLSAEQELICVVRMVEGK
ncbi:hypothetical protein SAMN05444159_7594 [Bradyrhizobium lablabi]|uniref:Uncharacterized protein n=2 Tax=Bradyrhizobium lablabi TaxID=722472 RepID=A0A1M7FSV7_9BRAD|nr:hypothetical protein SAMN05444159_7594 [Bradyrhizobium lablabi]